MDFQLLVVRGRSASEVLKLAEGVTTVGRHDDCQIRIKSSQVSRRHCELFEKKGLLLVKDLGSSNGTFVNGKKVKTQQVLESGDELTIGGVKLQVAKIGEAPAPKKPVAVGSGDTAIVEAVSGTGSASDDVEFEIDFDEPFPEPVASPPAPTAAVAPPPAESKKPDAPSPSPAAKPEEPAAADEAIADFLLDIKIDEDE